MRRSHAFSRMTNSPRVVGVFLLLVAAFFGVSALMFQDFRSVMGREDLPVVEAEVIAIDQQGRHVTLVEITFTTRDGKSIRAETEEFYLDPFPEVGDVQEVRYAPEDPEYYVQDVRLGNGPGLVVMLSGFALLFGAAGILSLVGRLPAWVLRR